MKIEVDDEFANIIVDAIDCLIKNYDAYGYKLFQVPRIAAIGIAFQERAKKAIKEADDEEEKFNKEHPEFTRGPEPGQKMVYGKGYVDTTKKQGD